MSYKKVKKVKKEKKEIDKDEIMYNQILKEALYINKKIKNLPPNTMIDMRFSNLCYVE